MRRIKTVFIVKNPKKTLVKRVEPKLKAFLRRKGVKLTKKFEQADIAVYIGGDGTILYHKRKYPLPIFAIGSERSFICQVTEFNWKAKLNRLLSLGFSSEKRSMLACEIKGRRIEKALNEVVIRSRDHRVVDIHFEINGKKYDFLADGVLFATPTGSTAYAYSCGGRELGKHARKYVVVGIAPYRRKFKPIVVSDEKVVHVSTKSTAADLVIDGQFIHHLKPNCEVEVRKSKRKVELVKV